MSHFIRIMPLVRLLCLAVVATWGMQVQAQTHQVSTATELRAQPRLNARIVLRLPQGTPLQELQTQGGWLEVSAGSEQGWVRMTHVQSLADLPAPQKQALASLFTANSNRPTATTGTRGVEETPFDAEPTALEQLQAHAASEEQARDFARQTGLQAGERNLSTSLSAAYTLDDQQKMGAAMAGVLLEDHPLHPNAEVQDYVNHLGRWLALQAVAPDKNNLVEQDWYFAVLDSDMPRLYSAPGGYVLLTQGLLQQLRTEDELATKLLQGILQSAAAEQIASLKRSHGPAVLQEIRQSPLPANIVAAIRRFYTASADPDSTITTQIQRHVRQAGYGEGKNIGQSRLQAMQQKLR